MIDQVLGCRIPMSAKEQKETFQAIVEETLGESCDFETVKNIHENLSELLEETKDEPVPLTLDKVQVKQLLENNGASQEKLEELEERIPRPGMRRRPPLWSPNVVNAKSFDIKTPDVSIKVAPDKTHLVETRMVDGRPCIVITINEHVEINGDCGAAHSGGEKRGIRGSITEKLRFCTQNQPCYICMKMSGQRGL